ncbi:MAG: hypothetical protein ABIR36_07920 [Nitrospiraceae bacterium]
MVMCPSTHDTISRDQRSPLPLNGSAAVIVGVFLLWISSLLLPEFSSATIIYSYIDERGTAVMTDNYETIPERYRAKVQATEHAPQVAINHSMAARLQQAVSDWAQVARAQFGTFTPSISGLTPYQSHVLSVGGLIGVMCLLARLFVRSQVVRFLALWCLVMLGLTVPALLFTSQDSALDLFTGRKVKVQEKQQDRLQNLP